MSSQSFALWLGAELDVAKCALLALYEKRDKLLYIDGPKLEKQYMDRFGEYEESVIKEEIECELLEKKQELMQIRINRHEHIDEQVIDEAIEKDRQDLLDEASGSEPATEFAELSEEDEIELQKLYKFIVKGFHPQTHAEQTQTQNELYDKAQEAYRRKDLEALGLLKDMLESTDDIIEEFRFLTTLSAIQSEIYTELGVEMPTSEDDGKTMETLYATDYTLAAQIYPAFKATNEELEIQSELDGCKAAIEKTMNEFEILRSKFPYSAREMLEDESKIEAYNNELSHRLQTAKTEQERLKKKISAMLGNARTSETMMA